MAQPTNPRGKLTAIGESPLTLTLTAGLRGESGANTDNGRSIRG
ncbi:hypothetical protein CCACVL1_20312 [Corchorus capsularis]|uniref:Uncharacterized protein n=1 Tax=Corchorus capsularis TaxID=210143 RepID=A0A1R3HBT3_COCAP|nr:hypothetical protein CCACVL1_20312 [Corchorus capsularis]